MKMFSLQVVVEQTGFPEDEISFFIEQKILSPFDPAEMLFDEEDLTRLFLIKDLMDQCSPNPESLEVILHLVDQLHVVHAQLKK